MGGLLAQLASVPISSTGGGSGRWASGGSSSFAASLAPVTTWTPVRFAPGDFAPCLLQTFSHGSGANCAVPFDQLPVIPI